MQSGMKTDIWDMSFCYQKSNLFIICSLVQLPCSCGLLDLQSAFQCVPYPFHQWFARPLWESCFRAWHRCCNTPAKRTPNYRGYGTGARNDRLGFWLWISGCSIRRLDSSWCLTHRSFLNTDRQTTPFAMWTAFPPSDYYGVPLPCRIFSVIFLGLLILGIYHLAALHIALMGPPV